VGQTNLNEHSSRSHSVFTIKLMQPSNNPKYPSVCYSKMSIVDLAGAESSKKANNDQKQTKEASSINQSLSVLGHCLEIMRENQLPKNKSKQQVVPFRKSVITYLFRDSLLGWGNIVMIVTASSSPLDYDETVRA
jgi:kinesin family protein 20